jgi:hypothetical protein
MLELTFVQEDYGRGEPELQPTLQAVPLSFPWESATHRSQGPIINVCSSKNISMPKCASKSILKEGTYGFASEP